MLVEEGATPGSRAHRQRPGLELFLWLLVPAILLIVHVAQVFEQFSTVGCEGICDLNLIFGARAAYPWEVAASIAVSVILAMILRLRGMPSYWAPLVGVALVLSSAIVTSVLFQAGLAPMYERNARIAQGEVPAPTPPRDPVGRSGTGVEGAPYLEFSRAGALSGYDGRNDLNGRWTQDPDGKITLNELTLTTTVATATTPG